MKQSLIIKIITITYVLMLSQHAAAKETIFEHEFRTMSCADAAGALSKFNSKVHVYLDGYVSGFNRWSDVHRNLLGKRGGEFEFVDDPVSLAKKGCHASQDSGQPGSLMAAIRLMRKGREATNIKFREHAATQANNPSYRGLLKALNRLTIYGFGKDRTPRGLPTWIDKEDWVGIDNWSVGYLDGYLDAKKIDVTNAETQDALSSMLFASVSWAIGGDFYNGYAREIRERSQSRRKKLETFNYQLLKKFEKTRKDLESIRGIKIGE